MTSGRGKRAVCADDSDYWDMLAGIMTWLGFDGPNMTDKESYVEECVRLGSRIWERVPGAELNRLKDKFTNKT